jgi:hypothetical protein
MTMKLTLPKSSGIVAFFGFLAAFFAGCSTSLTKYDLQEYPKTIPFFEPISLTFGEKTVYLDTNLQRAYSFAIDTVSYPMESCRGVAHIDATVTPDGEPSSWNIGATLIPFWPALPVSETWHYRMEARIFCHGTLTFKVEFEESEHVKAFWYGRMRADLVNDASQEMHRKLLERLKFETSLSRSTDLNLAQDY